MRIPKGLKKYGFTVVMLVLSISAGSAHQTQRVGDTALRNASKNGSEWITTGRDYSETRFSPLAQINVGNVARLGLAWYYNTNSAVGALEATPIVSNGILYGTLSWSMVFAVDARTGKELWRYDPRLGRQNFPMEADGKTPDSTKPRTGPSICCGAVNRGVAIYDGKVYVGLLDGRLVALDAVTGKVVWEVHTTDPNSDYGITGAPRIVKGMVIIGNSGGEFGLRGFVTAYDAQTGKQIWRFYTVPGDPSKPYENKAMEMAAKTWTGDVYWKMGGGANAWDAFAYDPDLDLIYFGTGNGSPYPQIVRSPGGGDNLFVCSILALHASTGKYAWHYQVVPADEWDYDSVQSLVLADLKINGSVQKVIMQAAKDGYFYVLNRKTGKFISAVPIVKVTWATGIDPKTGRPKMPASDFYDRNPGGVWLRPSGGGVHNWHPMSFNPDTKLAYIPGSSGGSEWFALDPNFKYKEGQFNWAQLRNPPTMINGIRALAKQNTPPPPPSLDGADGAAMSGRGTRPPGGAAANRGRPGGSFLMAWDPVTQTPRWTDPNLNGGGTMTTAGNLVFAETNDGRLVAVRADNGERLWDARLVPGLASPVTYMLDGKQYVSIIGGSSGRGRLYTFALGANMPIPTTPASPAPGGRAVIGGKTTQDGVYTDTQAARGELKYARACAACHASDLKGVGEAPPLVGGPFTEAWNGHTVDELFDLMESTMPKGAPRSLSADDYADILAYILKVNQAPAGSSDLRGDPDALKSITITGKLN
jgi:quinohemoprotein ethanol dehydrogenase